MNMPRVSVVIPTFRRPDLLERCLRAVMAQSMQADEFEVIVVDDGPSDDTHALARSIAAGRGISIRCLATSGQCGPAVARNLGWREARAAVIAFTDDDTIPATDWLSQGVCALEMRALVAVHGRVVVPTPEPPTDYERNTKGLEDAGFVTANCFVTKDALHHVGGFDERFERAWREDSDLYFSLIERVGDVGSAPDAIVVHPVRPGRWGECLRQHANQIFDALLYKKHPTWYRHRVLARPPIGYYLAVMAIAATVALLVAGRPWLALAMTPLWLMPIAGLTYRRLAGTSRRARDRIEVLVTSPLIPFFAVYWRLRGAWRFRVLFI